MKESPQPSLRDILGVIRSIINGEPVPPDFKRKQDDAARALPGKLVQQLFSVRTLVFIVLMVFVIVPAVRKFMSN